MDKRFTEDKLTHPQDKFDIALKIYRSNTCKAILAFLEKNGAKNVNQIVIGIRIEQAVISSHLRMLRQVGYVTRQQKGKFAVYTLTGIRYHDILREYAQMIEA